MMCWQLRRLMAMRRRARPQWQHSQRVGGGNEMDRENSMRAIGLVLLSIAIMALLLTDADAKRRSSAQGSQAAGASRRWCATYPGKGINDNCSYSSFNQFKRSWAAVAFADPIRFRARLTGPATAGAGDV